MFITAGLMNKKSLPQYICALVEFYFVLMYYLVLC